MFRIGNFREMDSSSGVARNWREGGKKSNCYECGLSFAGDENVLKLHGDDGCLTVNILKPTELYTFTR